MGCCWGLPLSRWEALFIGESSVSMAKWCSAPVFYEVSRSCLVRPDSVQLSNVFTELMLLALTSVSERPGSEIVGCYNYAGLTRYLYRSRIWSRFELPQRLRSMLNPSLRRSGYISFPEFAVGRSVVLLYPAVFIHHDEEPLLDSILTAGHSELTTGV